MKIVHICMAGGPVTDGFSYQDNLLSKYHKKMGYDVDFITSIWMWGEKGDYIKDYRTTYINSDGVRMIRLPMFGEERFTKKIKIFHKFYSTLEKCVPDIIFVHGPQFLQLIEVKKYVIKHPNVCLYVDNHADFSNSGTNWLSKNVLHKIVWRFCAQSIIPYAAKFYGVLPARVDWLVNMYKLPKEKIELLVMGADDDAVIESEKNINERNIRGKFGINKDDFLIMTGGKIDPWKKQTLLLMKAVAKIEDPRVKLIVFGSVDLTLKEEFSSLCIPNKVIYAGWIKSCDSYDMFAVANLVFFPGRHSVLWEQCAGQGKPMVCKYWEGTTHVDMGGNVKFLYNDSEKEIYNILVKIVNDVSEYERMKNVAKNKGRERFSYKRISQKAIELD